MASIEELKKCTGKEIKEWKVCKIGSVSRHLDWYWWISRNRKRAIAFRFEKDEIMATYIIENLKGFFRMMIIEAENEEVAILKSTKNIIDFMGVKPEFDLETIIRGKIRKLNNGEVIYVNAIRW